MHGQRRAECTARPLGGVHLRCLSLVLLVCLIPSGCTPRGPAPTSAAPSGRAADRCPAVTVASPGVTAAAPAAVAPASGATSDPPASEEPLSPADDPPDSGGSDLHEVDLSQLDFSDLSLDDLEPEEANPLAGCAICHVDAGDRFAGSQHAEGEIICTDCHGPSEGHVADENNRVKPDEVFLHADVDRLCGECHDCSRPGATKPPDPVPDGWKVCTECHGSHELLEHRP